MLKPAPYRINDKKKVRVIVDTDCYCEADDQFALAHHLMTPKIDVVGITAAHYADRWGPGSEEASFEEILHILDLMGLSGEYKVFHGARAAIPNETTPVDCDAARFIVEEAKREDSRPLFIAVQGALTNVASALLLDPSIAGKMTVVWIGGGSYPDGEMEFNLENDIDAANVVFDSAVELWQVPKDLYSKMYVPLSVLYEKVHPYGKLGEYIVENIERVQNGFIEWIKRPTYSAAAMAAGFPGGEMWIMGDQPTVGLISFDQRYSFEFRGAPRFAKDCSYILRDDNPRKIRVYTEIDRDFIMDDFYAKMKYYFGE